MLPAIQSPVLQRKRRRNKKDGVAQLLKMYQGMGPVMALAFSLTLGQIERNSLVFAALRRLRGSDSRPA